MLAEPARQAKSMACQTAPRLTLRALTQQIPHGRFCAAVYQALTQHVLQGGLCCSNGAHAAALAQEAQQHVHCPMGGRAACLHLLPRVQNALQHKGTVSQGGIAIDPWERTRLSLVQSALKQWKRLSSSSWSCCGVHLLCPI